MIIYTEVIKLNTLDEINSILFKYLFCGFVSSVASGFLVGGRTDKVHALSIELGEYWVIFGDRNRETVYIWVVAQQTAVVVTTSD